MIETVDDSVCQWAAECLGEAEDAAPAVVLGSPAEAAGDGARVLVHLADVAVARGALGAVGDFPPLSLELRYVLSASAPSAREGHRWLGRLLRGAHEHPSWSVDDRAPDAAWWAAHGVAPRPALALRVPLVVERPARSAPPVRRVAFATQPGVVVAGVLAWEPGGEPVPAAELRVDALGLSTRTDARGRFSFPCFPADPGAVVLAARVGRRRFEGLSLGRPDEAGLHSVRLRQPPVPQP